MDALIEIEIEKIQLNPDQPRKSFSDEELKELSESIVSVGLIHPPMVSEKGGKYYLIAGERRVRAAKLARLTKIPVVIKRDYFFSREAALIENIQRQDLNPIEIAKALKALIEECHLNQEDLAKRVGKKRSTIANYLRLLTLEGNIQNSIIDGSLSFGHAKVLMSVSGKNEQQALYEAIFRNNLSVRQLENFIQKDKKNPKKIRSHEPHFKFLQEELQKKLKTKVTFTGKGKKGVIAISYYNLDDLDRVLQILGIET